MLSEEGGAGEAALCVVADSETVAEPTGYHLSPGGVRLTLLVDDGAVSDEIEGGCRGVGFDGDFADGWCLTGELEGESVVPVEV